LPRARIEALAAGDWLDGGGNLIAIGNSGPDQTHGKTHILCAIGHALVEAGHRVFHTRTSDLVQRLQPPAAILFSRRHWPNSTSSTLFVGETLHWRVS